MPIFKCKMCGGDVVLAEDKTFGTCEYCGSSMTFPKVTDEQRAAAFNRGNAFRRMGEFDKALAVYERIVAEDDNDAEAHWCCALCRFGIEWVEDPNTFEYVPTCHRASFDSFLEDVDYLAAVEHSDGVTRRQYQRDGARINEVQRGILATSQHEKPFDVFICYKELDDGTGERTRDSIDAQEIYYNLTQEGYRVFFSRITLEDKVGTEYEPYIFAALNSAKVMVVLGSKPEYFNAVWVKNEWSRYLTLMHKDRSKLLLPCYKNMDPYDLPDQLSVLMSYDMTKIGFMQDLLRGIRKVIRKDEPKSAVKEPVIIQQSAGPNVDSLLKRVFIFLEVNDWKNAGEYCERVLDRDPENAVAYLGKLMAELRTSKREELTNQEQPFDDRTNYKLSIRYGDEALRDELEGCNAAIRARLEEKRLTEIYNEIQTATQRARKESEWLALAERFDALGSFRDAQRQAENCRKKAETARKAAAFDKAAAAMNAALTAEAFEAAAALFDALPGFRDAEKKAAQCREKAEEIRRKAEEARLAEEKRRAEEEARRLAAEQRKAEIEERRRRAQEEERARKAEVEERRRQAREAEKARIKEAKAAGQTVMAATERKKTVPIIAAILALLLIVGGIVLWKLPAIRQEKANKQAAETLDDERANLIINSFQVMKAEAGDIVRFGAYEQDNVASNGKEPIEWLVLDRDGDRILVLSRYALDCQQYDDSQDSVTWESCKLRQWLNGTFLNDAFSEDEQAMIPSGTVSADQNPTYRANPGNSTQDQVFLLSIPEAYRYIAINSERQCMPTAYAKAQGCFVYPDNGSCWWWLRSPGFYPSYAAGVDGDGAINAGGNDTGCGSNAVRPAMWIDVSGVKDAVGSEASAIEAIYTRADALAAEGRIYEAATTFYQVKDYRDARGRCFALWGELAERKPIAAGVDHVAAVKSNGTVVARSMRDEELRCDECGVDEWTDIVAVGAGNRYTVALKTDGSVVADGEDRDRFSQVSEWKDIVAIAAGFDYPIGLKADGTAVVCGSRSFEVEAWRNVVSVAAGKGGLRSFVGLSSDGSVLAAGSNMHESILSTWTDIVSVSAGGYHTVALKSDGTVMAVGENKHHQCDVGEWKDISCIVAGQFYTIGIKKDGSVLYTGISDNRSKTLSGWQVISVDGIANLVIGLGMDGTATSFGLDEGPAKTLVEWKGVRRPDENLIPRASGDLSSAKVGDVVCFGAYEQDGILSNGSEPIEWLVLGKEEGRILAVSRYALDCQPYNTEYAPVTWETCTLRKWLNDRFLNDAFSAEERALIPTVTVSADKNPDHSTSTGNSTQDRVFLLSIQEANRYFGSDEARRCGPTDYAIAQGISTAPGYSEGGTTTCWWWLRSPGSNSNSAARVSRGGSVGTSGDGVSSDVGGVRPALWIEIGTELDDLAAAAKAEGKLVVYGSCEDPYIAAVCDAFQAKYGIQTSWQHLNIGEVQTSILQENGNPSADVWVGGTVDALTFCAAQGLLEKYEAKNAVNLISDRYRDADGCWYGLYTGVLGLFYNADALEKKGIAPPQDWADLIKPEYADAVIWFSNPNTAATAKLFLNTTAQMWGEEKAEAYWAALDQNIDQYTKSGGGPSKNVGVGECDIGIGFLQDAVWQIEKNGYGNIGLSIPSSGTFAELSAVSFFKGAEHPNAAKLFIEFCLTPECAERAADTGAYSFLVLKNARQPEAIERFGLTLDACIDYDYADAKAHTAERIERFFEVCGANADDRFRTS